MTNGPAYHEAAHAVVAWLLGHRVRLTVDPADPRILGRTASGHCEILNPQCTAEDNLMVALAPLAAGCPAWDCADDLIQATAFAVAISNNPTTKLRDSIVGVKNIVDLPRVGRMIETLAEALRKAGTLGPDAVERAIARAAGPQKDRNRPKRPRKANKKRKAPRKPS